MQLGSPPPCRAASTWTSTRPGPAWWRSPSRRCCTALSSPLLCMSHCTGRGAWRGLRGGLAAGRAAQPHTTRRLPRPRTPPPQPQSRAGQTGAQRPGRPGALPRPGELQAQSSGGLNCGAAPAAGRAGGSGAGTGGRGGPPQHRLPAPPSPVQGGGGSPAPRPAPRSHVQPPARLRCPLRPRPLSPRRFHWNLQYLDRGGHVEILHDSSPVCRLKFVSRRKVLNTVLIKIRRSSAVMCHQEGGE